MSIYPSVENIMIKNSLPQHVLPPAHDEVVFWAEFSDDMCSFVCLAWG